MRIAVLADIHGNLPALEAVLKDAAAFGPDLVVDLGDCVSGPLWPRETFERLQGLELPTVRGNHDRQVAETPHGDMGASDAFAHDALTAEQRAALGALPFTREFAPGIVGFHATPAHDDRYVLDGIADGRLMRAPLTKIMRRLDGVAARIVLLGHSHRPDMVRLPDGRSILNPGSVGDPAYHDATGQAHVSEAGAPHARYALIEVDKGEIVEAAFRAVAYDWEGAARRAEENGRPDWAHALRTGFMPPSTL
jgi:predicted phosphodiesterase